MPVKTVKNGPGKLTIGATDDLLILQSQVTACAVEPEAESEDPIPVLSGEFVAGKYTEKYKLTGTFFQDLGTEKGVTEYTWANGGKTVPFEYAPNTAAGKAVSGNLVVVPTTIGGEVGEDATAEFEFTIVGKPTIGTPTTGT